MKVSAKDLINVIRWMMFDVQCKVDPCTWQVQMHGQRQMQALMRRLVLRRWFGEEE